VAIVVSEAQLHTKSELGAVATSRRVNPKYARTGAPTSWKLRFRLVATAPSSDFVLPDNSIPQLWITLFAQSLL